MANLTPISDVLAPSFLPGHTPPQKISPRPFVYLKLVRLRPVAGVDVSFRMRLSDGYGFVHAYFGSTAFDRFVHDGSIKAGQVLEIRRYKIGVLGDGQRFIGLVWIYPVPLPIAPAEPADGGDNGVASTDNGSNTGNGPAAAADVGGSAAVNDNGTNIVATNNDQNRTTDLAIGSPPAPPAEGSELALPGGDGHEIISPSALQRAPAAPVPVPVPVPVPNIWLLTRSSPKLTDEMLKMNRTMLNSLSNKNMRNANFLAVILERRRRPDSHTIPKQDWYLWDESSATRKTILSVWGDLCTEFQPTPGTIVALWNVQINTRYEDNPASARLLRLPRSGLGHLNAYRNKQPKGMLEPEDVEGYRELRAAWERARVGWGPEVKVERAEAEAEADMLL